MVIISVLQIINSITIILIILDGVLKLYRYLRLKWRWYQVKRTGANLQKCINEFCSDQALRENEFCRDCKHSEVSNNNGNLLCLHERSPHFGEAIDPEQDKRGFCWFERIS